MMIIFSKKNLNDEYIIKINNRKVDEKNEEMIEINTQTNNTLIICEL